MDQYKSQYRIDKYHEICGVAHCRRQENIMQIEKTRKYVMKVILGMHAGMEYA